MIMYLLGAAVMYCIVHEDSCSDDLEMREEIAISLMWPFIGACCAIAILFNLYDERNES